VEGDVGVKGNEEVENSFSEASDGVPAHGQQKQTVQQIKHNINMDNKLTILPECK
jgi:hypothetical protein